MSKQHRSRQRREGASQRPIRWLDIWRAWLRHHRQSAADSLHRLFDHPVSSLFIWLVIGIALALPVGMNVALDNLRQATAGWDQGARITLFLQAEVSESAGQELSRQLLEWRQVSATQFMSRQQALEEFRQLSGFADVLTNLDQNPLPNLIIVSPVATLEVASGASRLVQELRELPQVEQVLLDMQWIHRLKSIMLLGRRIAVAIGGLLIVGVLLVLGNTIRLTIEARRDEIVVVKLVGGSNSFVRRPLLYTGLWYGVGGGLIAWLTVAAALWFLQQPTQALTALYNSSFALNGLGLVRGLELVLIGGALGLSGAWLAVSRHIGKIEPR